MKNLAISFLLFYAYGCLFAQTPTSTLPCSTPEYQQFNFWIGEWDVYQKGKLVGTNEVKQILGECVIMENWVGIGPSRGKSFNLYNIQSGEWEQTWVDNVGGIIRFHGSYADGIMSMVADGKTQDGSHIAYKLTFWDNENRTVRQLWEAKKDEGEKWFTLFDGLYKKKSHSKPKN
ncbi:MAG TPA: hypothetical protein ENJ82_01165 [Bacteroidetes bacterium]|nr:hypothetical protein [Bacteroidota bacterium]